MNACLLALSGLLSRSRLQGAVRWVAVLTVLNLFWSLAIAQSTGVNGGGPNGGGGGGTPGGANHQVQVNNAGAFGGITNGTSGQVLTSNGVSSTPTFQAVSGGTPASPANSVQFNNSGVFGGSTNFSWDNTNGVLQLNGPFGGVLGSITGKSLTLNGGNAIADTTPAVILLQPGGGVTGAGGSTVIAGGNAVTSGTGGGFQVTTGNAAGVNQPAGSISMVTGNSTGSGSAGLTLGTHGTARLTILENGAWAVTGGSPGSAGNVLTSNGNTTDPSWQNINASALPTPTATTLGGVKSYAAVAHQWINTISTLGTPASTQPVPPDISGLPSSILANTQSGATYTLQSSDANNLVSMTNASGSVVTIPAGVLPVNSVVTIQQGTAGGLVTISAGAGVTLTTLDSTSLETTAQNDFFTIKQTATNTWIPVGALTALITPTTQFNDTLQYDGTGGYQLAFINNNGSSTGYTLFGVNNDIGDGPIFVATSSIGVDPLGHESGPVVAFGCSNHNGTGPQHQPCDLVSGDGGFYRIARIGQSTTDVSETEWFYDNHWSGAQYQFGSPTGGYKGANTANFQSIFVQGNAFTGFANPSGSVGPTATNGSATTAMRSDAAPAVNLTAAYQWTGAHTFSLAGSPTTPALLVAAAPPVIEIEHTGAGTDNKWWEINATPTRLNVSTLDDARTTLHTAISIVRSGNAVTNMFFGNATDNPAYNIGGTGTTSIDGSVVVGGASGGSMGVGTVNMTGCFINGVACVLSGTTGSIGGGALLAGTCTSGTATVTGATTSMAIAVTPVTYPGDGTDWKGYVSASNTVTVKVCALVAVTPTTSNYNVRVLQ